MGFEAFLSFSTTFRRQWGDRGVWVPTTVAPTFDFKGSFGEKLNKLFEEWSYIRGYIWYCLLSEPDNDYEFEGRWNIRPMFEYLNEKDRTKQFWEKLTDSQKEDYKLNYIENPPPNDIILDDDYALHDLDLQLHNLKEFLEYLVEIENEQAIVENPISFYFSFSY